MRFGHFDDAKREYVIETPRTPLPWINYLGSEDFFALVSNTAGGYAFYRDARLRRLTRYRYNNCPLDSDGFHVYVKDGDTVWNPGWQPTQTELDEYECRHGLGYTILRGSKNGIAVRQEMLVPKGDNCLLTRLTVTNESDAPRTVSLFPYAEFCLWDAMDDSSNFQRNFSIGEVELEPNAIYHKTEYRERRDHYAVLWADRPYEGFDTSRDAFIGVYGAPSMPQAVKNGACTGSVAHGWAPVGAMQFTLSLAPGASQTLLLGRGMGFRDSCQDLLGFVHMIPRRARERILDIAATQFPDGSAYHQYQPLTKTGNLAVGSGFNDDPLWLIAGTDAYLRETGDWTILDEPTFGEGKNSWLTGTAAWTFVSISQAILGVQPTLDGLAVAPCIPAGWAGYTVKRRYRGAVYRITVENPHHAEKGIVSLTVNGTPITGNVLPPAAPGTEVQVRVVMG